MVVVVVVEVVVDAMLSVVLEVVDEINETVVVVSAGCDSVVEVGFANMFLNKE